MPAFCRSQENGNAASFDMSQEINLSLTSMQVKQMQNIPLLAVQRDSYA